MWRLIEAGESVTQEFKSTLRMNLRSQQKDPAIEHAVLKTIAAFGNTSGGTLLIGVDDDRRVVGTKADGFENRDHFDRHFRQIVRERLGRKADEALVTTWEKLEGVDVFVVDVAEVREPVFLKGKVGEDEFYVRTGPQTVRLSVRDALEYAGGRFKTAKGEPDDDGS